LLSDNRALSLQCEVVRFFPQSANDDLELQCIVQKENDETGQTSFNLDLNGCQFSQTKASTVERLSDRLGDIRKVSFV